MPLIGTEGAASAQGFGMFGAKAPPVYIEDVFSTYLFTANGSTQTITNNINLSTNGGLVVFKGRSGSQGSYGWGWFDTARGTNKSVASQSTAAQLTSTDALTAFTTTGFTLGADSNAVAGNTFSGSASASWTFRKQAKFFDIVTYTGDGTASRFINHNLRSTPGCIIVKRTDAASVRGWVVDHTGGPSYIYLNLSNASNADNLDTSGRVQIQSDTQFQVGSKNYISGAVDDVNQSGGSYVAYLFAHNAGGFGLTGTDSVISCGSYTGNGSTTGTAVTLGWEPQWIMVKNLSSAQNWVVVDSMRGMPFINSDPFLYPNLSSSESSAFSFRATPTGFQLETSAGYNTNGNLFIYIAIRRGPMRVPTTGSSVFNAITRNGTGATYTSSSFGFTPDLLMLEGRNSTATPRGIVFDRNGGFTTSNNAYYIKTTSTDPAFSFGASGITAVDQTTYTAGAESFINASGGTYVDYAIKRAPGFFDIAYYIGTGATLSVNHNLGVVPQLIIVKNRNTAVNWAVYSDALGPTKYLFLNATSASSTATSMWNDTAPTASTFTVGFAGTVNNAADPHAAYLFATLTGVSKVGSFTGNGSSQTINCGFTTGARFILIKRTDSPGSWYLWDSARGITAGNDPYVLLNSTTAEYVSADVISSNSTGFTVINEVSSLVNVSGGTYIYLAIA